MDLAKMGEALMAFGGHLECKKCGKIKSLGSIAEKLIRGWPKCCGETMTWYTARQLEKESDC